MLERHLLLASILQKLGDHVAAKDGTKKGLPSLFGDWDDLTDKEVSSRTTNTKQLDNDLASLKQSIDNHGKSIEEAAARIEVQERKETADKDCLFKINAKACAAILHLGVEEQELTVRKGITLQENNQVFVNIYDMQIATISAQIEFHQAILAAEHVRNETPKKGNKTPTKIYANESDSSN